MPSPKGQFTKATGPLAGTYSSYYQYQNIRAQQAGFPSYGVQRRIEGIGNPLVSMMINRTQSVGGRSREAAAAEVRAWYRSQPKMASVPQGSRTHTTEQGRRKHDAIKFLMDRHLYPEGQDAADEIPY